MNPELQTFLDWYIRISEAVGLPALLLAGIVTWLRFRSEKALEALRSDLRRVENEAKTRFDWLHRKRGTSIIKLYGLITDLDVAAARLSSPHWPRGDEVLRQELFRRYQATADEFRSYYPKAAIFFSASLSKSINALDKFYDSRFIVAHVWGKAETREDIDKIIEAADWSKISEAVAKLREELQTLLGIEKDSGTLPNDVGRPGH